MNDQRMRRKLERFAAVCFAAPEFALRKFDISHPSSILEEVHSFRRKFREKGKQALRFLIVSHHFSAPLPTQSEKPFPIPARKYSPKIKRSCRQLHWLAA